MLFLDVLSLVQKQTAMGVRLNTTPLSEIYLHLWREVFCQFSETESVGPLVPYVRSILHVYVSVYHALLSKPIEVNF
jgi:hypothetical protein